MKYKVASPRGNGLESVQVASQQNSKYKGGPGLGCGLVILTRSSEEEGRKMGWRRRGKGGRQTDNTAGFANEGRGHKPRNTGIL